MDRYKSERQITKEFLNESFLDRILGKPEAPSGDEGIHTRELKKYW